MTSANSDPPEGEVAPLAGPEFVDPFELEDAEFADAILTMLRHPSRARTLVAFINDQLLVAESPRTYTEAQINNWRQRLVNLLDDETYERLGFAIKDPLQQPLEAAITQPDLSGEQLVALDTIRQLYLIRSFPDGGVPTDVNAVIGLVDAIVRTAGE